MSAETIRKAAAIGPVAAVEVEYSPFALEVEENGVLATCKELGIPIIAYRCARPALFLRPSL